MSALHRIVLVRHGETVGASSIRYFGSTDIALSAEGRAQARAAARSLPGDGFGLVVSSPLMRAWQSAAIVARGRSVLLDPDLREIDFGHWEGLTAEEIEASDPARYRDWREGRPGFEYPGGERRARFEERVDRAAERWLEAGVSSVLVVVHKGVIRALARLVADAELPGDEPRLGGWVQLTRQPSGSWALGRRPSAPE